MQERVGSIVQENVASGVFGPQEISFIQCVALGWTGREYAKFNFGDPSWLRNRIAEKMMGDTSFEERVRELPRLPFVSEGQLTPMEGRVAFLSQAGFRRCEIARMIDMDQSNVSLYRKRIEKKRTSGRELAIPPIEYGSDLTRLGIVRGIHHAISGGLLDTTLMEPDVERPLSINESRTLLLFCYGLSLPEIATLEKKSGGTVKTYYNRIKKKLGVSREGQMIASGMVEIVRLTS